MRKWRALPSKASLCRRLFGATCRGLVKGTARAPDISEQDIDTMFSTNVTGLINMTQAVLPIFKKREDGGRGDIINIGSIAGRDPYAGGSVYCATKSAVRSFTDSLRRELIATKIRVIEVDPGQVETVGRSASPKLKSTNIYRNSRLYDFTATRQKLMQYMRKFEAFCCPQS